MVKIENRKKLMSLYIGPFTIIERKGVNSVVNQNGIYREIHNLLKEYNPNINQV